MDLVLRRYSGPFFIDYCIQNSVLSEFIDIILYKEDEEKFWELYLASLPYNEMSFTEWKKEVNKKDKINVNKTINMSKAEFDATIKKSEEILRGFRPPKKGGNLC